ncbi:MAG: T9SS type A sorting domain-containing protein [Bacteroidota bacterium]|nr:T9SS type A sorting domain-containing protein [Bacteroidota bacterium]
MKKLFLFAILGLSAFTANAQLTITPPAVWCCGTDLTVTGSWFGTAPGPSQISWQLFHSDAYGEYDYSVYGPLTGAGPVGTFTFPNTSTYTTCGEYYSVQLGVLIGSTWNYTTQLVYANPTPQPAITGSASCGFGNYSATPTGSGYTYQWSAFLNTSPFTSLFPNGSNCGVGTGDFNKVKVIVTDANGCSGTTTLNVTNTYPAISADYTITRTSYGPNDPYYYITITRNGSNSLTGVTDVFQIQDITSNAPMSYNNCWTTSAPSWSWGINLFGYDGSSFFTYTNNCSATVTGYAYGRLLKTDNYRMEHYVWVNGCMKYAVHEFNFSSGIYLRTGSQQETNPDITSPPLAIFNVFPNPGNGTFQIKFNEPVDNAQAELFNIMGERVEAFTITGDTYSYSPTSTLAAGVYLLRINNNGTLSTNRIVVE